MKDCRKRILPARAGTESLRHDLSEKLTKIYEGSEHMNIIEKILQAEKQYQRAQVELAASVHATTKAMDALQVNYGELSDEIMKIFEKERINMTECNYCKELYSKDDLITYDDGNLYCENCQDSDYNY